MFWSRAELAVAGWVELCTPSAKLFWFEFCMVELKNSFAVLHLCSN